MTKVSRPLPEKDNLLYQPYFEGLKNEIILVQKCDKCSKLQWPPRELCKNCQSNELNWSEVPQEGTIYTYSIVYRAPHPWFQEKTPYGLVIVELTDGIRMLGNYLDSDIESLECGMHMKAKFEMINEDITLIEWEKQ